MDVSDIFYFFLLGEGEGGVRGGGEGGDFRFLLKIPGGGSPGGGLQEGEGKRGREGVCGESGNLRRGGGLNIFFRGRNVHQGQDLKANLVNVGWGDGGGVRNRFSHDYVTRTQVLHFGRLLGDLCRPQHSKTSGAVLTIKRAVRPPHGALRAPFRKRQKTHKTRDPPPLSDYTKTTANKCYRVSP